MANATSSTRRNGNGNGSLITRLWRLARFNYLKVLRLKDSAHSMAMGMALGVFIGFMPIIPLQAVTVITLAIILKGNKVVSVLFTCFSNPFNAPIFYYFLYRVGAWLLGMEVMDFDREKLAMMELIAQSVDVFLAMMFGGLVLGVPSSIATYFVGRKGILVYRRRRALRLLRRRDEMNGAG